MIEQQQTEIEVIKWYELVIDCGLDTKELMRNIVKLKRNIAKLEVELNDLKVKSM